LAETGPGADARRELARAVHQRQVNRYVDQDDADLKPLTAFAGSTGIRELAS
jgi:hypothetical protein